MDDASVCVCVCACVCVQLLWCNLDSETLFRVAVYIYNM